MNGTTPPDLSEPWTDDSSAGKKTIQMRRGQQPTGGAPSTPSPLPRKDIHSAITTRLVTSQLPASAGAHNDPTTRLNPDELAALEQVDLAVANRRRIMKGFEAMFDDLVAEASSKSESTWMGVTELPDGGTITKIAVSSPSIFRRQPQDNTLCAFRAEIQLKNGGRREIISIYNRTSPRDQEDGLQVSGTYFGVQGVPNDKRDKVVLVQEFDSGQTEPVNVTLIMASRASDGTSARTYNLVDWTSSYTGAEIDPQIQDYDIREMRMDLSDIGISPEYLPT